jgi:hypothetical protein
MNEGAGQSLDDGDVPASKGFWSISSRRLLMLVAAVALTGTVAGVVWIQTHSGPPAWADSAYRAGTEREWERLEVLYPLASRPEAKFERFVSDEEYQRVTVACLQRQGVSATVDELGVAASPPIGQEQRYALAWFACDVTYPLEILTEEQPYEPSLMRETYRYFGEALVPCLEQRDYEIEELPTYAEFRQRWWTDDPWSPYRFVQETDAETVKENEVACPPMPQSARRQ